MARYHNAGGRFGVFADANAVKSHAKVRALLAAGKIDRANINHTRDNMAHYGITVADVVEVINNGHVAEDARPTRRQEERFKGWELGLAKTIRGEVVLVTVAVINKGDLLAIISVYPKDILDPAIYP